jgi:hypothetical protein
MKQLTVSEKFALIRNHADSLARVNLGIGTNRKSDVIEWATRIIELAKAIPKDHWSPE